MSRVPPKVKLYLWANAVEISLCTCLMLASIYYLIAQQISDTTLGATFGSPWDTLTVVGILLSTALVFWGTIKWVPILRALGLIGICTEILILDISYIHLRGLTVALYAILTNLGIVIGFGVRVVGIVSIGDYPPK